LQTVKAGMANSEDMNYISTGPLINYTIYTQTQWQ